MARPSKYSPELAEQIAAGIRVGLTTKDAALVAGISEDTLARWQGRFAGFADLIARARAQRAATFLARARETGKEEWRFWLEMLDRCEPDYRKRQLIEADVRLLVRDSAERLGLSAEEERALFDRIRALLAAARLPGTGR